MCPEYGATVGFFPVDERTMQYLKQTGRTEHQLCRIKDYLKANNLFVDYTDANFSPNYTKVLELDLSTITACVSGPKRPHDQVALNDLHKEFKNGLTEKVSFKVCVL